MNLEGFLAGNVKRQLAFGNMHKCESRVSALLTWVLRMAARSGGKLFPCRAPRKREGQRLPVGRSGDTAGTELHNVSAYLNTSWELVEREPAIEEQYRDSRQL